MFRSCFTQSGQQVSFYTDEIRVSDIEAMPNGSMIVDLRSSNNFYDYQYLIKHPDGTMYSGYLKSIMQGEFLKGYSWSPYQYTPVKHYPLWGNADFYQVAEAVEQQAGLLATNKKIKIIDAQYINYRDLSKALNLKPTWTITNDEWVRVRDAESVVALIAALEQAYLRTQQIDKSIILQILQTTYFTKPEWCGHDRLNKDKLFWDSLQHRLLHLYNHPENASVFEVKPKSEGMCLSGYEYVDPIAVIRLVKPSCEAMANCELVKHVKGPVVIQKMKQPISISNSQMANSVFGRKRPEGSDNPWTPEPKIYMRRK